MKIDEPSYGWFDRTKSKTRSGARLDYTDPRSMGHCGTPFWIFHGEMVGTGRGCCEFCAAISSVRNSRSNPCEPIWRASGKIIHCLPASQARHVASSAEKRILTVNVKHVGSPGPGVSGISCFRHKQIRDPPLRRLDSPADIFDGKRSKRRREEAKKRRTKLVDVVD